MSEPIDKMRKLEDSVTEMHLRMKRMERATNWYDSIIRRLIIFAATYVVALGIMLAINDQNAFAHAFVPAVPVLVDLLAELLLRRRLNK